MTDIHEEHRALSIHTIARDCGYAMFAIGLVYVLGGESAIVYFVYGYAVSVVICLLLLVGWSHLDFGDDDFI